MKTKYILIRMEESTKKFVDMYAAASGLKLQQIGHAFFKLLIENPAECEKILQVARTLSGRAESVAKNES